MSDSTIDNYRDEGEKAEQQAILYQKIYEELRNNPAIQAYYKDYDEKSVDQMLSDHAKEKIYVLDWTPKYIKRKEIEDQKHFELAKTILKQIQHKKLFNLQSKWRAELVAIPEIETSEDFSVIGEDILNSKLIPPVTEDELSLYISYMKSEYYQEFSNYMPDFMWQFYFAFKIAIKNSKNPNPLYSLISYPAWYYYYDLMTGDSSFNTLPDIRGEKEKYYSILGESNEPFEEIVSKLNQENSLNQNLDDDDIEDDDEYEEDEDENEDLDENIDENENANARNRNTPLPDLHTLNHQLLAKFVYQCESKDIYREYLEATGGSRNWLDENELYEGADEIVSALSDIAKVLPVQPNENWLEGLKKVLENYEFNKTKEQIYPMYEQYLMYIENGISFEKPDGSSFKPMHKASILKGRKKAGEPEDFNF